MTEFTREHYEKAKRELEQQEELRKELFNAAALEWAKDPEHSYAEAARKFGIDRTKLRYFILKRSGAIPFSKKDIRMTTKETEEKIQAIPQVNLQKP